MYTYTVSLPQTIQISVMIFNLLVATLLREVTAPIYSGGVR
jgi:hypothetical protein